MFEYVWTVLYLLDPHSLISCCTRGNVHCGMSDEMIGLHIILHPSSFVLPSDEAMG